MANPKRMRLEENAEIWTIPEQPAVIPTVEKPVDTVVVVAEVTDPSQEVIVDIIPTEHPPHLMGDVEGGVPDVSDMDEGFQKPITPPSKAETDVKIIIQDILRSVVVYEDNRILDELEDKDYLMDEYLQEQSTHRRAKEQKQSPTPPVNPTKGAE